MCLPILLLEKYTSNPIFAALSGTVCVGWVPGKLNYWVNSNRHLKIYVHTHTRTHSHTHTYTHTSLRIRDTD